MKCNSCKNISIMQEHVFLQILFSVVLAVSVYIFGEWVARWCFDVHKIDLFWGITLRFSLIFFIILAIAIGIVSVKLDKYKLLAISILSVIILSSIIGTYTTRPFRTLLLCLSGIIGLVFPIVLLKKHH